MFFRHSNCGVCGATEAWRKRAATVKRRWSAAPAASRRTVASGVLNRPPVRRRVDRPLFVSIPGETGSRRVGRCTSLVHQALMAGEHTPLDFQPFDDASKRYYRGHGNWHEAEARDFLRFDR